MSSACAKKNEKCDTPMIIQIIYVGNLNVINICVPMYVVKQVVVNFIMYLYIGMYSKQDTLTQSSHIVGTIQLKGQCR
jgi:hypothetical protein